jgi:hypothetical protein
MITVTETNHGTDGWDAKSKDIATYDDWQKALDDLRERGFYVDWGGFPIRTHEAYRGEIYHHDKAKRWTMGCISYSLKGLPQPLPHNRLP